MDSADIFSEVLDYRSDKQESSFIGIFVLGVVVTSVAYSNPHYRVYIDVNMKKKSC